MTNWTNQVCVITGAGSGIGAGLALHAAELGMQVVATDVDEAGLAHLAATAQKKQQSITTLSTDVRDADAVEQLAEAVFNRHGEVKLLFNNAGVLVDGKSWDRSLNDWRWGFDVNIMGVVHGIHSFVPRMLEQNTPGTIVNTSSVGGLLGGAPFMGPYQATKHAIVAMTETLQAELAMEGGSITAACLCPGNTPTSIWDSERLKPEAKRHKLSSLAEQQQHDAIADMCAGGISADEVAKKTFEAIDNNQFWIFPQPEFKAMLQQRLDSIVNC